MSKNNSLKNPLKYTPNSTLPKLGKIKTDWDLVRLYYAGTKDPRIEKDIVKAIKDYTGFAKKWRKSDFTTNSKTLTQALGDYKKLCLDPAYSRPGRYFSLRSEVDVRDSEADKALATLQKRMREASNGLLFFSLELGKISIADQKKFLSDPLLKEYKYFLSQIFRSAKYDLSEAEEKIIRLKSPQSSGLWQQMTDKLVSTSEISWSNKKLHLPEAFETIETLKSKDKPKLWKAIIEKIDTFGVVAEHEFNAIITDVRTEDDLRGYKKPYSATAIAYQHDEKSIEALIQAVSTKGFALSKEFYDLKAKYHGVGKIHYSQKYDSIGSSPAIPFDEALTVCRDVFYQVNLAYGTFFDEMLTKGQIDVYPKKGKRGGAFMSSQTGHPIQVMLNHTSTMKSLETLAHEMGHAVHSHRSSKLAPLYDGHSIVTAETASTLFENLVFNAIYDTASTKDKIVLLHDKITGDIATMQRQIAFFNCELEIHNTIHSQGAMTHDELKACMTKHLRSYLGKSVEVGDIDGASYIYIPHLRYGFYVYSYTFGNLMSTIMSNHYRKDNSYRDEIEKFLSSGQSDNVVNLFKQIGINTTKADTFISALSNHENDIKTFKKLISK